jgi:glycerol uptake facilitator protein
MNIFLAETIGTMILILLGDGVVANVLLSKNKGEGGGGGGAWIVITAGWGFAVAMGVYAAGFISGGHINPAVTIPFAVVGIIPWSQVPAYLVGQFLGAFIGAILVWLAYLDHFAATDNQEFKLLCFSTEPAIRNYGKNLLTEIIGTFMLLLGVFAIFNPGNGSIMGPGSSAIGPYAVGILVFGIGLSLGGPTGYAINPARDLSPRIAHWILPIPGKRDPDWGYAWIPVVGPIIGGILGAIVYQVIFGAMGFAWPTI